MTSDRVGERANNERGNESVPEVLDAQVGGERTKIANQLATRRVAAATAHRPDVVVTDRRRVVEGDLFALRYSARGNEVQPIRRLATAALGAQE